MIGVDCKIEDRTKRVVDAAEKATFRNLSHAAASIRNDAISSIESGDGPSQPGTAPHTHTQKTTKSGKTRKGQLPRAITFDATKQDAAIGPRESVAGLAGHIHEMGDDPYGESDFPERPFMAPALERALPRMGDDWAGSIGG